MFRFYTNIIILLITILPVYGICPKKCVCKKINDSGSSLKVKCGGTPQNKISTFKELDFDEDFENIVNLDLSKNQISFIEYRDFLNYTNLKRLDLSYNSLKHVDETMFGEILMLMKLNLSTNMIVHIFQGSFEKLKGLKQLDISGNPLACDCDLLWLVGWSNTMSIKLQPPPKCESPPPFKGFHLKKLKVGSDLHCESPLQPLLELKPDKDQLVFEGDELVLRCRAPRVAVGPPRDSEDLPARAHVFWGWSDKIIDPNSTDDVIYRDPSVYFPSIQIDAKHLSDSGLLDSILKIPYVTRNHTGMWDCRLSSQQANLSRTISVIVISEKTKYCPAKVMQNNKGKYYWPRTITGKTVRLPCTGEAPVNLFTTYKCNNEGNWEDLNTNICPFISESTRILEQFSKVNLSIARGSVLESAKRLRNYTRSLDNLRKFRDPIDVVFITRTLRNYLNFVSQEKDLGSMLLDIVSHIMILPSSIPQEADVIDSSGIKLIQAIEIAAQHTPQPLTHKENLAIEYFKIRTDSFAGITCTWFRSGIDAELRTFQCNAAAQQFDIHKHNVDASIQIPSLFLQTPAHQFVSHKLMIAIYQNSNFFPQRNRTNFYVTSAVIGVKIISESNEIYNLTEPISVILRVKPYHNPVSAPVPVWWDSESNSWSTKGCQFSYSFHSLLVFSCNRLGYYGLLQNKKYLNDFADENAGARFRLSPLGFYIGSIILFACNWINIVTYISCGNSIQMGRKQRHALVNTWLALSALTFVFSVGIFQTEDYRICQILGISIHYFSLCVILWVCVSVSNMYKRLSKRMRLPLDDIPKENVGRKPILGIYLVGWGIGLIICGISGAVNIREYASYSHCFLKNGPALSAIFVPATILLLFLSILFICVRCHIRNVEDHNGHFSEGTQATENVDIELLDTTGNGNNFQPPDRYRSLTLSSPTTSTQDDLEHTNASQLRAYFIFLILFVTSWLSAAASIVTPFEGKIMYEEETFSIFYAIISSLLGMFILIFYCISRSDVRSQWRLLSCKNCFTRNCCRSRSVSDTKEINTVTYHQPCGTINSGSRSNSQCSKNRPPSATNHLKHSDLNSAATLNRTDSPNKIITSPSNLLLVNRQQFVHNPVVMPQQDIPNAEMFYNPEQINVARKFFKKQKRLAKRNNFELQRHIERGDFGDGASDISSTFGSFPKTRGISIFSSGSKVNNTNIHVKGLGVDVSQFGKDAKQSNNNPNILSDSCNESDMIVDAERLVLGAEGLRVLAARNKVNNTEMVANIYTNVPETSQPQHEVVTMRADEKFRKSVNINDLLEQDEIDMERNDLNSQSDRTSTPLYVNGNIRNIIDDSEQSISNCPALELQAVGDNSNISDQLILSLNSPIAAMNTIGLPEPVPLKDEIDEMNISNDENMLDLGKNEAYISESLQITDRIYQNPNEPAIRIHCHSQKSKSLIELDIELNQLNNKKFDGFHEVHARSISCSNLSQIGDDILGVIANPLPAKNLPESRLQCSPILFSPSLCEIDDLPSPQDRRKPISLPEDSSCIEENSDSALNMFAQAIRRNFSSSPTNESDLNYQNSELSIRSHGLYAPQPDNDLTIALTGDDHIFFPYHSSEVSDIEDENDFDDFNNCSNDCLLPQDFQGSQSSIDELYQRITRRTSATATEIEEQTDQIVAAAAVEAPVEFSSMVASSGEKLTTAEETDIVNENDDDSSQCSIISYIDPNEYGKNENSKTS